MYHTACTGERGRSLTLSLLDRNGRSRSSPPMRRYVLADDPPTVHVPIPTSYSFELPRRGVPRTLTFLLPQKDSGEAPGTSSWLSCVINLSSTCMGTGILALPAAFVEAGLVAGNLLCISCAVLTALSLYFLDQAATSTGIAKPEFYSVCEALLPNSGSFIDVAVLINGFGSAASYLVVVGDSVTQALPGLLDRRVWIVLAIATFSPLCFLRKMDALRVSSLCAVLCLLLISLMILAFGLGWLDPCPGREGAGEDPSDCRGPVRYYGSWGRAFAVLPLFVNSFTCQQNCFPVLGELERPTAARKLGVIGAALTLPTAVYLVVGNAASITFGSRVASNVLNSYPHTPLVGVSRLVLALVLLCAYPMQALPIRL